MLSPRRLDRSTAPERLPVDSARILQRCDCSFRTGTLFGAFGAARTQIASSANTVTAAFAARGSNGRFIALDASNGTVRATPGDGSVALSGPLNMWPDGRTPET